MFWLERVSPHDIFQERLPDGAWRLLTGAGLTLSIVRIEATGYLLSIVVQRMG